MENEILPKLIIYVVWSLLSLGLGPVWNIPEGSMIIILFKMLTHDLTILIINSSKILNVNGILYTDVFSLFLKGNQIQ